MKVTNPTILKWHGERISKMPINEILELKYKIEHTKCSNDTKIQGINKHKWIREINEHLKKVNNKTDTIFEKFITSKKKYVKSINLPFKSDNSTMLMISNVFKLKP